MPGTWTLTAPDGRTWQAESPIRCVALESRERVPAEVRLQRIYAICDETPDPLYDAMKSIWAYAETQRRGEDPALVHIANLAHEALNAAGDDGVCRSCTRTPEGELFCTVGQGCVACSNPLPPSGSVEVVVERGRVWIRRGVQSFMLAYDVDTDEERQWYAGQLRNALGVDGVKESGNGL